MLHILLKRHEYLQDYTVSELERSKFESKRKCVLQFNFPRNNYCLEVAPSSEEAIVE
jgi:hypothetical protein